MTKGTPWRQIGALAFPLLLGNVFQASYNLIDVMIIGRFVGPHALAGVGIASPVFNLLNALLMGISGGASIVVSQLFGARKQEQLRQAVSSILWLSLVLSLLLTAVGLVLAPPLLVLLETPKEAMPYGEAYLQIILAGLVCNVFYNQLTGMLRGLGNTKAPLYFLVFACFVNVGLDLLFVRVFWMGVAGAALATVISQGLSALLTGIYLAKKVPELHPKGQWRPKRQLCALVLGYGLPIGLQQASVSLGHVLMQRMINPFGTALIDGYTAAVKVDNFAVMPVLSVGAALSTFSAQNAGAGRYDRVRSGCRTGCVMILVICVGLGLLVTPLRQFWVSLFVSAEDYPQLAGEIVRRGAGMLAVTPPFYWLLGLLHAGLNTMAGAGDTGYSMKAMIGMMAVRVAAAWWFLTAWQTDERGIWWSFPISWVVILAFTLYHYSQNTWQKKGIGEKNA